MLTRRSFFGKAGSVIAATALAPLLPAIAEEYFILDGANAYIKFGTAGGIETMRIMTTGNVGMGITNPSVKLHIFNALTKDDEPNEVRVPTERY